MGLMGCCRRQRINPCSAGELQRGDFQSAWLVYRFGVSTRALPGSCRESRRRASRFCHFRVSTRALPGSCREGQWCRWVRDPLLTYQPVLCRGVAERVKPMPRRNSLLMYQPVLCRGVAESGRKNYARQEIIRVSTRALPGSCRESCLALPIDMGMLAYQPVLCRGVAERMAELHPEERQSIVSTRALPGSCREVEVKPVGYRLPCRINPCSAGELQRAHRGPA